MSEIKCQTCGADCAVGTSFCRQCGSPIDSEPTQTSSEQPTALLGQLASTATQRLESRTTGPDGGRLPTAAPESTAPAAAPEERVPGRRGILIGTVALLVLTVICAATLIALRGQSRNSPDVMYPGARTVMDMTAQGGGRALHLETTDTVDKVEEWYTKTLKPEKTIRLTATSVVIKNDKTTATIAADGNKTSILIKVVP